MHRCVTFRGTQPFPSVQPWRTDTIGSTGRENRIGRRVQVHRAASWIPFVLEVVAKPRLARVSRQDSRTRPSLGGRVSGVVRCYGRAAERKHCGRTHLRTEGIGKPRPSPCTTSPPRLMSLTSSLSLSLDIDIDARFCPAIFELEITRPAIYRSNLLLESTRGERGVCRANRKFRFVRPGSLYTPPKPFFRNVAGSSRAFSRIGL